MNPARGLAVALALACVAAGPACAEDFQELSTQGLARSRGVVVRVLHPPQWRKVPTDDEMALVELRGRQGELTGILQIGRGRQRSDMATLCTTERARTMLRSFASGEPEPRVTDVVARPREGRPAYEIRYERSDPPDHIVVRTVLVCLKDSQLVVSCAGAGEVKAALPAIDPVCNRVLDSLTVAED